MGAGIQIPPNSSRLLAEWGLLEKVKAISVAPKNFRLRSYSSGAVLSTTNMLPFAEKVYNAPYLHVHRADYHKILVDEAKRLGVEIFLNARVTAIDFVRPAVLFEDRPQFEADLIVGADGLKSVCREAMLGRSDPPYLTGDLAYRIILDVADMRNIPVLADLVDDPNIDYWLGPDCHVVSYMLQGGKKYNVVLICPDDLPESVHIDKANLEEMRSLFRGWDSRLTAMLSLVKETNKWRLRDSREMRTWTHQGRFVLIGDACHATLPYLAQGAAQAIEDGAVLGALLSKIPSAEQVPGALLAFEALRKPRTERIVKESRGLRSIFHLPNGLAQKKRDSLLTTQEPFEGFPNRWADPSFQKFLFGYDVNVEIDTVT